VVVVNVQKDPTGVGSNRQDLTAHQGCDTDRSKDKPALMVTADKAMAPAKAPAKVSFVH
jgi:hypothetical protein